MNTTLTIKTNSPEETRQWGEKLGHLLPLNLVIALHGDLGAGKTTLTQGIAAGFGVTERVTSPTFTLVNEYEVEPKRRLIHIDSYRLGDLATENQEQAALLEADTFGLDEILDDGDAVVLIEWAERVASLLPADHLSITLLHVEGDEDARQLVLESSGVESLSILQRLPDSYPNVITNAA